MRRYHWALLGLLLLWGLRLYQLDALPLFIDETILVRWSLMVQQGDPLAFGVDGRYLTPWTTALFTPDVASGWIVRAVSLLWTASTWGLLLGWGLRLGGPALALSALVGVAFAPFMLWHDRLALADNALATLLLAWAFALWYAFTRPQLQPKWHILASLIFLAAFLTKSSALLLLPLPLCAALLLPRWGWHTRWRALAWQYSLLLLGLGGILAFLRWRSVDFLGRASQGTASDLLSIARIHEKAAFFAEGMLAYLPWPLLVLAGVALLYGLWQRPRQAVLPALAGLAWISALILVGDSLYLRYFVPALPFLALAVAVGLLALPTRLRPLGFGLGLAYAAFGLAFWGQMVAPHGVEELALPAHDRLQYITADSSGFAIPQTAAAWSAAHGPDERLLGLLPQCETLRLYLPQAQRAALECPNLLSESARPTQLEPLLAQADWLALEQPAPTLRLPADWPQGWTLILESERPGAQTGVLLYRR